MKYKNHTLDNEWFPDKKFDGAPLENDYAV